MQTWLIFAVLSAVSASLVAIFGKIGISNIDSTLATAVRSVIMALILVGVAFFSGKFSLLNTINGNAFLFIFLAGLSGALSWLFYFLALKFGPATSVAAIDRLSVVFVVLLAAVFLGEQLTIKSISGVILLVTGAFLLIK